MWQGTLYQRRHSGFLEIEDYKNWRCLFGKKSQKLIFKYIFICSEKIYDESYTFYKTDKSTKNKCKLVIYLAVICFKFYYNHLLHTVTYKLAQSSFWFHIFLILFMFHHLYHKKFSSCNWTSHPANSFTRLGQSAQ